MNFVQYSSCPFQNKYKLLKPIGKGGGGEVYLAEHIPTRQQRVVKLVSKDKTGK